MRQLCSVVISLAGLFGATALPTQSMAQAPADKPQRARISAFQDARMNANELAAAATLRNVASAQAQCQASGVIDANGDGLGEYGYFAELAGFAPVRGDDRDLRITPAILSKAFGKVKSSIVTRSGYCFAMFLPDATGAPVAEAPNGGSPRKGGPDARHAADHWCAYAWPHQYGGTGQQVFFVNEKGDLFGCENTTAKYSGTSTRPGPVAAYPKGTKTLITDLRIGPTNDGQVWQAGKAAMPRAIVDERRPARRSLFGKLLGGSSATSNESAAIATLRNLASAQAQCQASGLIDENEDGAGEYGYFGELAGAVTLRGGDKRMRPPVMSAAFGMVDKSLITRAGYCFQLFLPGAAGHPTAEAEQGGASASHPDPNKATTLWCCYAWPLEFGKGGRRAFFMDQSGDVLVMPNEKQRYSGAGQRPVPLAAFAPGAKTMENTPVRQKRARDGGVWAPFHASSPR